jgi:hypothetical protein
VLGRPLQYRVGPWAAMLWLLVHGKVFRVDDTTYFGFSSSLTAHQQLSIIS